MSIKYQFKLENDWTGGEPRFHSVYKHVEDHLRFHRGDGFKIKVGDGDFGPLRRFREIAKPLEHQLNQSPVDKVVTVRSLHDGYHVEMRRHQFQDSNQVQVSNFAHDQIGDGYLLGAAGPSLWDCSGLTLAAVKYATGQNLYHKATVQMHDPRVHSIKREQIKPMDMLFLHGNWWSVAHVAFFLDYNGPGGTGRVIDAEPSDTGAPAGWPTGNLGTGVRIRPMISGYYCDWESVVKIGRLYSVNGKP